MYNFKKYGGTFKGLAGECMFQVTRKKCFLTRFHPLEFILRKYKDRLNLKQIHFIKKNYLSFDAIEFGEEIIIYEIKTRNIENYRRKFRFCITQNTCNVLQNAKKINIHPKFAIVLLKKNWAFEIIIESIEEGMKKSWIHTNNRFDKTKYSNTG